MEIGCESGPGHDCVLQRLGPGVGRGRVSRELDEDL